MTGNGRGGEGAMGDNQGTTAAAAGWRSPALWEEFGFFLKKKKTNVGRPCNRTAKSALGRKFFLPLANQHITRSSIGEFIT